MPCLLIRRCHSHRAVTTCLITGAPRAVSRENNREMHWINGATTLSPITDAPLRLFSFPCELLPGSPTARLRTVSFVFAPGTSQRREQSVAAINQVGGQNVARLGRLAL